MQAPRISLLFGKRHAGPTIDHHHVIAEICNRNEVFEYFQEMSLYHFKIWLELKNALNPFSPGTDFRPQTLTSKVDPRT